MVKNNQQPVEAADKPARMPRTEDQVARHKAIRDRFQREKPALEDLVSTGEYNEPLPMGEYLSIRQAVFALRKAREAAALSLADVAERTGIDKAALSRIETGQNPNPTVATLCRYAQAFGKNWVWRLVDEEAEVAATTEPAATNQDAAETSQPHGKKTKTAAALAAQVQAIQDILAKRGKQILANGHRTTHVQEGTVEIREKRYVVHFTDAFTANMTDLAPGQHNPMVLLLERIQDPGEDGAVELLHLLMNCGEAQQMAFKIFQASEMDGEEAEAEGLTARKLLGLIAHYALEGATEPDAPVQVEVWHDDDTGETYPATMVSGNITKKVLTIYARGDQSE